MRANTGPGASSRPTSAPVQAAHIAVQSTVAPHPQPSRTAAQPLRERLLDAAADQLAQRDWAQITMADVALAAGVCRSTLYKEFQSRPGLGKALATRETNRALLRLEDAIRAEAEDPATALCAALGAICTALTASAPARSQHARARLHGEPLIQTIAERSTAAMRSSWPEIGAAEASLLSECLIRLAISHQLTPGWAGRTPERSLASLLESYLQSARARGPSEPARRPRRGPAEIRAHTQR